MDESAHTTQAKSDVYLILKTKDKKSVKIKSNLLRKYSNLIGNMLETTTMDANDGGTDQGKEGAAEKKQEIMLPFYNITSDTINQIIDFLEKFDPTAKLNLPVTATNIKIEQIFQNDPY